MTDVESRFDHGQSTSRLCTSRLSLGAATLLLISLAGCEEMMADLIDVADVSYCSGCDWIVQEFDIGQGWSTHNSDPYDDAATCEKAKEPQAQRNDETGYRCIYEGDLHDLKTDKQTIQWEADRVKKGHCWGCDWRIEEWNGSSWTRLNTNRHETEGLCEQDLWYGMQDNPYGRYRCTY